MQRVSVAAGVVGAVTLVLHALPALAAERAVDGVVHGGASWLPTFGTVGQTATAYLYASRVLAGLALVLPGLAFGYYVARERDVRASVRQIVRDVAVGSTVGVVGAALLTGLVVGDVTIDAMAGGFAVPLTIALSVLGAFVEVALVVTVATLAGAAVATFDTGTPTRPASEPGPDPEHRSGVREN